MLISISDGVAIYSFDNIYTAGPSAFVCTVLYRCNLRQVSQVVLVSLIFSF